jgi:type I restriction enzyme S subunit
MSSISQTELGKLIEFQRGYDLPKSEFISGEVPVISSNGILGFHNQAKVKAPGITIGRSGTVGLPHYIEVDFFPHNTALFIKDFKGNIPKYIYYLIKTLGLNDFKSGSGVPTMNRNHLHPLKVNAFLEIDDQQKIASVLSSLDSKIELNNRINLELETMAKTIYDYWFVQFDFPDRNGKPYKSSGGKMVWNEELKREIPEGWEVKDLQEIAKCIMGQSPKGESYNQNGIGTPLLNGPADYENGALKGRTFTTEPTRLCQKNDLVLCIRATIGNLVYSEQEFCLGRGVAAVRANDKRFSEFIYYLLIQEIERFKVQATGSIILGITKDDLIESKCLIPKIELISSFHNLIKPQFDKIRINKKENQQLSSLRDWLLPMLMNGQVKIN